MTLQEHRGVGPDSKAPQHHRRPAAATDAFLRPAALEVASGWVYGSVPGTARPDPERRTPRAALDDAIRPALLDGPCYVTFSGGRDSSAVLAAATALARKEGHQLPVPVTRVYPDLPDTDESVWQRAVIDHLELTDWIRLELRDGESDLLGDTARGALRTHGLLWPPALQTHGVMFRQLRGGALLTGEGGDAVLGARRITPLAALLHRRRPHRALVGYAVVASLPRPTRRRIAERMLRASVQRRWLQPAAFERHVRLAALDVSAEPLRYGAATWSIVRRRSLATVARNHAAAAAEYGVRAWEPLLDQCFVAALARTGGVTGPPSRTASMQLLFSDILPPAVLCRTSKASFNHAHAGEATRDFVRTWDGRGVDPDLADIERLRSVWLSDEPTMATGTLLHSAWLATEGLTP